MFAGYHSALLLERRLGGPLPIVALALALIGNLHLRANAETTFERVQLSDQFYSEGGTHADYDGDGHGDVAVGPWIYYGPQFTSKSRFYTGDAFPPEKYSENFLMFSSDVNSDSRPDILVLGFPGKESWWYENPGPNGRDQLWKQHTMLDSVDNESPLIGDIDGDGRDDLICSSKGHYGYATHAGQDPAEMWRFVQVSPNNGYQRFTHGLGIGDVNNDGFQDLLEKDGWWQNPGKVPKPANDKDQTVDQSRTEFWAFHPFAFSSGGAQMYAIDLDGDARNEVLTGLVAHGYGLVYYKALNAEATQFERVEIMTDDPSTSPVGLAVSQLHAMQLGDINRDGLPDLVTGKRWWAHANKDPGNSQPATLLWLELQRNGPRTQFLPHVIDNSSGVGTQITVGDVNGDGLLDIVSGNKRGAYLFLQRPTELPAEQAMVSEQVAADTFDQQPALEVIQLDGSSDSVPALAGKPMNFSFETDPLSDWEVRGPMSATARSNSVAVDATSGKFIIDTGSATPALIGELISRPFKLAHQRLSFLLGGKSDAEARVELLNDETGLVMETLSPTTEKMQRVSFDIGQYTGKIVRLRIIDHAAEAYLQVDDFRLQP